MGLVMSPWLFNVYTDSVVPQMNSIVLCKMLELLRATCGCFEITQPLLADDIAAD